MRLDREIAELATRQYSCVAVWQLRELGANRTEILRFRRSTQWRLVTHRVLCLVGSPLTQRQLAVAAVLDAGPGARLSHQSAAALWSIGASYRLQPFDVMGHRGSVARPGELGPVHPLVNVPARWLTTFEEIPVVRPELCIYQLCGSVNPLRAERALDTAWSMGLVSGRSLGACLDDLAERGRNGTVVLRRLLEARGVNYIPPATGLEARFQEIMMRYGLGKWRRQIDSGGDAWAGRVDFRHEVLPLIAEVQSERYHESLSSREDDAARRARLEAAGFMFVEVWDVQVWNRAPEAASIVRRAVLQLQARRFRSTA